MKQGIIRFVSEESGATALEYGLMAALIAGVLIAALTSLGQIMNNTFNTVANSMNGAAS